jgi:hypothetical protein
VRRHDERPLQGCGGSEHNTRPDDRVALELGGQSFEEGVALHRVDRRGGGLNGIVLVVGETERHMGGSGRVFRACAK